MAGPFPGMDPYLEDQGPWPDFHGRLIAEICNELGRSLPDSYVARVDERIEVTTTESDPPKLFHPDVLVGGIEGGPPAAAVSAAPRAAATLEPKLVEVPSPRSEELRITWVEIRALPELVLVTAVEVLSPINKSWQGRRAYLDKRSQLHDSRVNLVEIDLLLNGAPLPMKRPLKPGAYYAIVARGSSLPVAEVYEWSVRDPLPRLPMPLREPDPDVHIDLGDLVNRVYDLGRYSRTLRHGIPLKESNSLTPEDRAWAESLSRLAKPTAERT